MSRSILSRSLCPALSPWILLRVEFLLQTDSGYPKDTGVNNPWQPLGIPSAITPIVCTGTLLESKSWKEKKTPASLGYPLSVFNKDSTLKRGACELDAKCRSFCVSWCFMMFHGVSWCFMYVHMARSILQYESVHTCHWGMSQEPDDMQFEMIGSTSPTILWLSQRHCWGECESPGYNSVLLTERHPEILLSTVTLHPRNPPNREPQIPWYRFKLIQNFNFNVYQEIPRNLSFSIWSISGMQHF